VANSAKNVTLFKLAQKFNPLFSGSSFQKQRFGSIFFSAAFSSRAKVQVGFVQSPKSASRFLFRSAAGLIGFIL
jgi:hypothetical protein